MGVKNLIKFIEKYAPSAIKYKNINSYKNRIIGFDGNLLLYKIIYGIRGNGYDLTNNNIIVTHIHSLLMKFIGFHKYNIMPVFVFDGNQPEIKYNTLKIRKEIKEKYINKYKNSKTDKGKRIYYYMKSDITQEEINQCRELIDIFGYPNIEAKEEADSQLAQLYNSQVIEYIASDDMDILLFGGGILLKNFSIDDKKKIQEINLQKIFEEAEINSNKLIQIGILLGTDYCDNLKSSPTKAYDLLYEYGNLHKIPFVGIKCDKAVEYFKNPPVKTIKNITFQQLDQNKLKIFLSKLHFKNKYIDKILNKFEV